MSKPGFVWNDVTPNCGLQHKGVFQGLEGVCVRKRERNRRSLRSAALRSRRQLCCESWGRFSMESESSHSHNFVISTGGVMGLRPTQGDEKTPSVRGRSPMGAPPSPLSSRPKRTRISCHAALDRARCAPFFEERRMMFANATHSYRKSGGAQWRDLCVDAPSWKYLSTKRGGAERSAVCFCVSHTPLKPSGSAGLFTAQPCPSW